MKIDQIEAGISTFEVPGSKWNLPLFLPGSSLFLPAGDMGGEIKYNKKHRGGSTQATVPL